MAIIYSYPVVSTVNNSDTLVISVSDTTADNGFLTKSLTADTLASYVTARVNLNFLGNTGTGVINLDTQNLIISGTSNEIETSASSQTLQIGLPDNVTITNNLTVSGQTETNTLNVTTTSSMGGALSMTLNNINNVANPVAAQDAATKAYVDSLVSGGLVFKGSFRADTGEILSGVNTGSYLYNCPGGAGTRVAVSTGDYYIVANSGGQFYCSGDLLNVGDSIMAVADAPVDSSTVTDWATLESDNIEGSGTANKIPIWTDSQILADSLITQDATGSDPIFDVNGIKNGNQYTPPTNTVLYKLKSGSENKFSITQDGGGGVVLPSGNILNNGPSFNLGGSAFSNGENAISVGAATTAFGNGSLAANFITLASGGGASAFGLLTEASALASAVFGNKSKATGNYSIASGQDSIASGQSSVAIGEKGDAQGKNSFVSGFGGTTTANNAVKFGYEGSASGNNSAKFGFESIASGINSLAAGTGTTASGSQSIATGDNNIVSNSNSFVGGKNSTVTGASAFAFGQANNVSSLSSATFGQSNTVNGFQSFVAGFSNNTNNFGNQILLGIGLNSSQNDSIALGRYNDNTDSYNKFQIGNGTGSGSKSNALSINAAGNIKIPTYGSGTVTGTAAYNLSVAANGQIIETTNPTTPDYLKAVFLLSQTGTNAPANVNLLENGLGIPTPFNWSRVAAGEYNLNATGKFKSLKTVVFINNGNNAQTQNVTWEVVDADNLKIYTGGVDGALTKAAVEIITYN